MPEGPTCHVFQRRRRHNGRVVKARTYTARIALAGEQAREYRLGVTDKSVAKQRAMEILRELERERAGMVPPRAVVELLQRPLSDLITDYVAQLATRCKAGSDHPTIVGYRLKALATACGWSQVRDITAASFETWRAGRQSDTSKNLNHYLADASAWSSWLCKRGVLSANPFENVERDQRGKVARERRALTRDEAERLLGVAGERLPVYLLMMVYALRRQDVEGLRWGDFEESDAGVVLRMRWETQKSSRPSAVSVREDVWRVLRRVRPENACPDQRVFPHGCPDVAQLKADLSAAKIPFVDATGRRIDMHALRHTGITEGAKTGVPLATLMAFARHTDASLTTRIYTDRTQILADGVADRMPRFEAVANWERAPVLPSPRGTRELTLERDGSGRFMSRGDATEPPPWVPETPENTGLGNEKTACVASGRTPSKSSVSTTLTNGFSVAGGNNSGKKSG